MSRNARIRPRITLSTHLPPQFKHSKDRSSPALRNTGCQSSMGLLIASLSIVARKGSVFDVNRRVLRTTFLLERS